MRRGRAARIEHRPKEVLIGGRACGRCDVAHARPGGVGRVADRMADRMGSVDGKASGRVAWLDLGRLNKESAPGSVQMSAWRMHSMTRSTCVVHCSTRRSSSGSVKSLRPRPLATAISRLRQLAPTAAVWHTMPRSSSRRWCR